MKRLTLALVLLALTTGCNLNAYALRMVADAANPNSYIQRCAPLYGQQQLINNLNRELHAQQWDRIMGN